MTPGPMRVRLSDVARMAGVSTGTASEALNGIEGVNDQTRDKVRRVAAQLGYTPNRNAQRLAGGSGRSVGILFSGPSTMGWLFNPIFMAFFQHIQAVVGRAHVQMITEIAPADTEQQRAELMAAGGDIGVLVLIGTRLTDVELLQLIDRLDIPVITMVRHSLEGPGMAIAVDNEGVGRLAARHLLDLGHVDLGYIGALPGVSLAEDRLRGFVGECESAGIRIPQAQLRPGDFYQESGHREMRWLLDESRVTGVFCANDLMAVGAMTTCLESGVGIPEQVSLLGCDGIPNLDVLAVPLSTIALPVAEMGTAAGSLALSLLRRDKEVAMPPPFPAHLEIRQSTGPVPRA